MATNLLNRLIMFVLSPRSEKNERRENVKDDSIFSPFISKATWKCSVSLVAVLVTVRGNAGRRKHHRYLVVVLRDKKSKPKFIAKKQHCLTSTNAQASRYSLYISTELSTIISMRPCFSSVPCISLVFEAKPFSCLAILISLKRINSVIRPVYSGSSWANSRIRL